MSDTAPYKVKNDIWAGDVVGETQDPKFWKDLKPVEIEKKSSTKTQGRNVSGCPWKKGNSKKQSLSMVSLNRRSWEQKKVQREKLKALKTRMAELTEQKIEEKRALRNSVVAKRERKRINEMKSA